MADLRMNHLIRLISMNKILGTKIVHKTIFEANKKEFS